MSTWFELRHGDIRPVEVECFTDKTVTAIDSFFGGRARRRNRISDYTCYFPTFDEAKAYAIERAQEKRDNLRKQLERANGDLGRIKGMKNPQEPTP